MVTRIALGSVASVLLLSAGATAQVVFDAADVSGAFEDPDTADVTVPAEDPDGTTLTRPQLTKKGNLLRMCPCLDKQPAIDEIRGLSDVWLSGGTRPTSHGFSNMVWSWGQFIDHDVVTTVDGDDNLHPADIITITKRGMSADMRLHRLISDDMDTCPRPIVVNTAIVDAGTVYSNEPDYLRLTLRKPNSCELRTSEFNMLPISSLKNSDGHYVFLAGDVRVDEHAVLTMMHTVWMREHNRLCRAISRSDQGAGMSNDEKFNLAKNVLIAKVQDITVREFLPLLGITEEDLRKASPLKAAHANTPDVSVEFSTAAYRFGHDLVPDFIGPHSTVSLFNGNAFYGIESDGKADFQSDWKLSDIALVTAQSRANEIDGKFSDTLRDTLFGDFGEDLASRNIYRGRDMKIADYGMLADCYGVTKDTGISGAVPPFVGLLRDNKSPATKVLGPVQRAILVEQFHRIFFGAGGDWWEDRLGDVAGFEDEIHAATLGSVINANTKAFVQPNAFMVGPGGAKQPPYAPGNGGSDGGDDGDDGDGGSDRGFVFPGGFPSFPPGFPQF